MRISGLQTTGNYWKVLYIKPLAGTYFTENDAKEGAAPVAVLSAALWRNRFGGDASIVGKSIVLNGTPTRVLGVAPPDYVVGAAASGSGRR